MDSDDSDYLHYDDFCFRPRKAIKRKKRKKKKVVAEKTYNIISPIEETEKYIGDICIGTSDNNFNSNYNECTASFACTNDTDILLLNFDDTTVVVKLAMDIDFLKDLFTAKVINLKFVITEEKVFTSLYFKELPIVNSIKLSKVLKPIFNLIFNIAVEIKDGSKTKNLSGPEEIIDLYRYLKENCDIFSNNASNIDNQFLNHSLHPYQNDAVRWMLNRETKTCFSEDIINPLFEPVKLQCGIIIYYDKYSGVVELEKPLIESLRTGGILADEMGLGKTLEVLTCILKNPMESTGVFDSEQKPVLKFPRKKRKLPTVDSEYVENSKKVKIDSTKSSTYLLLSNWYNEVLDSLNSKKTVKRRVACICGNTENTDVVECIDCKKLQHIDCLAFDKSYGEFTCMQCWYKKPNIICKGTLLICPASLKKQWIDEIFKHIKGNIQVLVYEGFAHTPIYPITLKNYDIVITTYTVLQNEMKLAENEQKRNLRNPPKYCIGGSPIVNMKWWRMCLDEAQVIENKVIVSEMARRINAEHRWAVTGTPISKNMSDLFTLINYLQFIPYSDEFSWQQLLYTPYLSGNSEPMYDFLSKIMWRTSKKDVLDQVDIPNQEIVEHWLEFTPVERYFYDREHEARYSDFARKMQNYDQDKPLKTLDRSQFKEILAPFLSLRQACSHHNAVKGKYLTTRKPVSSMSHLLEALIEKNTLENEEFLRILISTLNGLAGIHLLLQNPKSAVDEYKKALEHIDKYNKRNDPVHLNVDTLQIVHIFHNLWEILNGFMELTTQEEIDEYKRQSEEYEIKYLHKFNIVTLKSYNDLVQFDNSIDLCQKKFLSKRGVWYGDAMHYIITNNLWREYSNKVESAATNDAIQEVDKYIDGSSQLLYLVTYWDDSLYQLRREVLKRFKILYTIKDDSLTIPANIVHKAMNCHLRPENKKDKVKKLCELCDVHNQLKLYESKLFNMQKKVEDVANAGSWKSTIEEHALKAIYQVIKHKEGIDNTIADGKNHITLLEEMKTEFKTFSKFWQNINFEIGANDELNMCKMRFSLKDSDADTSNKNKKVQNILKQLENDIISKNVHEIAANQLEYQKTILYSQEVLQIESLAKNLGTYSYLQTLKRQQFDGQKPDPCPVCRCVLDKQWNILKCGHCYCLDCMQLLIGHVKEHFILCSICRQKQHTSDISFIHIDSKVDTKDETEIKGNVSTKMEAVIRLILQLKLQNEHVKILVFSNWQPLLNILQNVLDVNRISNQLIRNQQMDKQLKNFKDPTKNITTLLLPVTLGSKGLNLVEASQVIFLESVIDPAEELQAIGRVHRIGQTRETTVHKFLMKNTIEEKIHHSITSDARKWNQNTVTLRQIVDLFTGSI